MKEHYIFIEFDAGIRFDFSCIANESQYSLYLIVSRKNYATLSQASIYAFREIIIIDEVDFNFDNLLNLVRGMMEKFNIIADLLGIITHDEYSIGVSAKLRETLGTEGDPYSRVVPFTDKLLMKEAVLALRQPKHLKFDPEKYQLKQVDYVEEIISKLGFPLFIKPLSRASCFETAEIHNEEELLQWLSTNCNKNYFEIDEFVTGTLYHCDSIVQNGDIKHVFISQYNVPCAEFMKGKAMGSFPLKTNHPLFNELAAYNQQVLETINVPDNTVTHFEFFRNNEGEFIFLEIANRAPGGELPFSYRIMSEKNVEEILVRLQMQIPIDLHFDSPKVFAAFMRFPKIKGIVKKLINPKLKSAYSLRHYVNVGNQLVQAENLSDMVASMVIWNCNYEALMEDFKSLSNKRIVETEQEPVGITA